MTHIRHYVAWQKKPSPAGDGGIAQLCNARCPTQFPCRGSSPGRRQACGAGSVRATARRSGRAAPSGGGITDPPWMRSGWPGTDWHRPISDSRNPPVFFPATKGSVVEGLVSSSHTPCQQLPGRVLQAGFSQQWPRRGGPERGWPAGCPAVRRQAEPAGASPAHTLEVIDVPVTALNAPYFVPAIGVPTMVATPRTASGWRWPRSAAAGQQPSPAQPWSTRPVPR